MYYEIIKPKFNEDGSLIFDLPPGMTKDQILNSYLNFNINLPEGNTLNENFNPFKSMTIKTKSGNIISYFEEDEEEDDDEDEELNEISE